MVLFLDRLRSWQGTERGQDVAEYGFLVFLIAIGALLAVEGLGVEITQLWVGVVSQWPGR